MVGTAFNNEEKPRGDMRYAVTEAVKALGFAYANPVGYTGPMPDDMGQMRAGAAILAQPKIAPEQHTFSKAFALLDNEPLSKAKSEALSKVPVGPVGSYSSVQEIVNKIRVSVDLIEVNRLSSELDAVINSTERLKGEEQDPETKAQKVDRLLADIRKFAEDNTKQMQHILPHASKEQKEALSAAQAELDAANASGDKLRIAAAEVALAKQQADVATNVKSQHLNDPTVVSAADTVVQNKQNIEEQAKVIKEMFASPPAVHKGDVKSTAFASPEATQSQETQSKSTTTSFGLRTAALEEMPEQFESQRLPNALTKSDSPAVHKG